jgi:hypothetical protein
MGLEGISDIIVLLAKVRFRAQSRNLSVEDLVELQHDGIELLKKMKELGKTNQVWKNEFSSKMENRVNFHSFFHLLFHDIPLWGNVALFRTQPFESFHQVFKNIVRNTNKKDIHITITNTINVVSTLRFIVHGGCWGKSNEYRAGNALRQLSDPLHPHVPHPLLRNLTCYFDTPETNLHRSWICNNFEPNTNVLPSDSISQSIQLYLQQHFPNYATQNLSDMIRYQHLELKSAKRIYHYNNRTSICTNDHIEFLNINNDHERYASVEQFYQLTFKNHANSILLWYGQVFTLLQDKSAWKMNLPTAALSKKYVVQSADSIVGQVMIVNLADSFNLANLYVIHDEDHGFNPSDSNSTSYKYFSKF